MATITITLPEPLSPEEQRDLRYLVSDALYEFAGQRASPQEYVEKRYSRDVYAGERRDEKVKQVGRRNALALKLWDAALQTLKVE